MSLPDKLKCSIYICCLDRSKKTKIELYFNKYFFTIYFIEPLKDENLKEIKEIFFPFISKDNRIIKINYIYIKSIYTDSSQLLKFTLHNAISTSIITVIFNHLKYKKSLIFPNENVPSSMLTSYVIEINKKITYLTNLKFFEIVP